MVDPVHHVMHVHLNFRKRGGVSVSHGELLKSMEMFSVFPELVKGPTIIGTSFSPDYQSLQISIMNTFFGSTSDDFDRFNRGLFLAYIRVELSIFVGSRVIQCQCFVWVGNGQLRLFHACWSHQRRYTWWSKSFFIALVRTIQNLQFSCKVQIWERCCA